MQTLEFKISQIILSRLIELELRCKLNSSQKKLFITIPIVNFCSCKIELALNFINYIVKF